jgi:hypothetical protein
MNYTGIAEVSLRHFGACSIKLNADKELPAIAPPVPRGRRSDRHLPGAHRAGLPRLAATPPASGSLAANWA